MTRNTRALSTAFGAILALTCGLRAHAAAAASESWMQDWGVPEGFSLSIDTEGYRFPTSIAFVQEPGPGAKDPLYFVTELRGTVKVVTNDRSVLVFAERFFELDLGFEIPDMRGEAGLGAVCLDPEHGYVFVSYAYQDADGAMHNDITRFRTAPGTFSAKPIDRVSFTDVFDDFPSSRSHQIGHMAVVDGALHVGVGDALDSSAGRSLETVLGKVLRMSLDGEPLPDNPFYSGGPAPRPRDFVWAYGLRNPFGLVSAAGRLFAADNGPGVDRFIAVTRGRDYAYDGTDWSMGLGAAAVFAPSVGPVQVVWHGRESSALPVEYRDAFYLALGGSLLDPPGESLQGARSVVRLPFDPVSSRATGSAEPVLRYRGSELQLPAGLALGPDGLYVAPLFAVRNGEGAVLRLSYEPARPHPFVLDRDDSPPALIASKGCLGCHSSRDGIAAAPTLEPAKLVANVRARIEAPAYARSLREIDRLDAEPYPAFREARAEVARARGPRKVRLWIEHHLLEPSFDSTASMMPRMDLTEAQAIRLADYFVEQGWVDASAHGSSSLRDRVTDALPPPRHRHVALAFVLGLLVAGAVQWAWRWRR